MGVQHLQILSLNYQHASIEDVGLLHVAPEAQPDVIRKWVDTLELQGMVFLSTCNRVEFIVSDDTYFCMGRTSQLLAHFNLEEAAHSRIMAALQTYRGEEAMRHLMRVASSLESMVLGEREILTQVRQAFDLAMAHRLAGDRLRVAGRSVVETAKKVFTQTDVATQAVSVNSLGWQAFKAWNLPLDAPILLIGAGATNTSVGRFLMKAGYHNLQVVNRTLERAKALGDVFNDPSWHPGCARRGPLQGATSHCDLHGKRPGPARRPSRSIVANGGSVRVGPRRSLRPRRRLPRTTPHRGGHDRAQGNRRPKPRHPRHRSGQMRIPPRSWVVRIPRAPPGP